MSDAKLARRVARRDERAFAEVFERYHQEIYRFCLSILGNPEDAREALQSTMLKALQSLPGEKREIRLRPWLYRVAHNEAIDLVRRRRETAAVDPELAAPGDGLAETAAQRERLRQLLLDLGDLPDRQRAALVMRELGGLGFEQIAEAFDTSAATARQTVYEARVNLRSLEQGREMSCEEVMHRLSNADGRVNRRRDLRAHLRACPDCRAFHDAIDARRRDLAALAPLPAVASAGVLHAVLGGAKGAAGGAAGAGGTTAAAGAGAGKAVGAGLLAKSAATVAVVAAIGVSGADRAGLIHTGLPGGTSGATPAQTERGAGSPGAPATESSATGAGGESASSPAKAGDAGKASAGQGQGKGATRQAAPAGGEAGGHGAGSAEGHPLASGHGRETAEGHRNGAAASPGQGHRGGASGSHRPPAASHHGRHGGHAKARGGAPRPHARPAPKPAAPTPPKAPEKPSTGAAAEAERSSNPGANGAESGGKAEGMP
jgi:RNA polymerase sigma factor (sigma-70 family)